MSLSKFNSDSAEFLTVSRYSRCDGLSRVLSVSSVMPMMAFMGVRISWLIVASSRDLACVASESFSFRPINSLFVSSNFPRASRNASSIVAKARSSSPTSSRRLWTVTEASRFPDASSRAVPTSPPSDLVMSRAMKYPITDISSNPSSAQNIVRVRPLRKRSIRFCSKSWMDADNVDSIWNNGESCAETFTDGGSISAPAGSCICARVCASRTCSTVVLPAACGSASLPGMEGLKS